MSFLILGTPSKRKSSNHRQSLNLIKKRGYLQFFLMVVRWADEQMDQGSILVEVKKRLNYPFVRILGGPKFSKNTFFGHPNTGHGSEST